MRAACFLAASMLLARGAFAAGLDAPTPVAAATPVAAPSQQATPAPLQSAAIYVYADDSNASKIASRATDAFVRRAQTDGWRPVSDPRIPDLLERAPADLVRTADALALARASYKDGLEQNGRLRLDGAEEALLRAKDALLEAAAAPDYNGLRQVHLYLGIVALNQGQPDVAAGQFRSLAFLAPAMVLSRDVFPPSVQEAFASAKRSIATGSKGALRVEVDGVKTATLIFDGVPKGSSPKTLLDLPEGEHYLEVRAPGFIPQLVAVNVLPALETPTIVTLRPAGPSLRSTWMDARGEAGAAALARIVEADRLVLGAVRTTVTGVSPFTVRGAAFDAALARRVQGGDAAVNNASADPKLQKLAQLLFRAAPTGGAAAGASYAALVAARERFLDRDSTLLTLEAGGAWQDHVFDAHGSLKRATLDAGGDDFGFKSYVETRAVIHARYGLREQVTLVLDVPLLTRELIYDFDDGNGTRKTKRTASGLGDVVLGADIRLPAYESPLLAMLYLSARVKMPSGQSTTPDFLRHYRKLVMGSGQWDVYGGVGGLLASGNARLGFEAGYNARLPDRVNYAGDQGAPQFLNIGDEEHLHLDASDQISRWLAPELFFDFTHRHATQHFQDPVSHDGAKAREMYLANLGAAVRLQISERTEAGAAFQHPVWGRITKTLFPLDVTGPRGWIYYGVRF